MIHYFTEHPTASNIFMVVLILIGITALPELPRETFPEVKAYEVEVSATYAGASASDVEQNICLKLEDATDGIRYLIEKRCDARDNLARFTAKMKEGGDMNQFIQDVKDAVDAISDFPDEVETPVVKEKGLTSQVISVGISGEMSQTDLKEYAEYLKQKIMRLPDVSIVNVEGFSTHQLRIEIPEYRLRMHGLSISQIAQIISRQNVDTPAGEIKTLDRNYSIRIQDQRRTAVDLADLVILRSSQGTELKLGDIATIRDTFETDEERIELNGKPAALLSIQKNSNEDGIRIKDAVARFVSQESKRLPKGVELILTNDAVSVAEDRLQLLISNGGQGLILVFLAMWLFFSFRYSFWVAMGLPVSFLASFMVMSLLGMSINMISMVALLIALGILMDDAIVLAESIATSIDKAKRKGIELTASVVAKATSEGVKKVARGVLSSFITTVLVFGSLIFLKGDLGQILKVIPIVLISVLSVSLIEAFLILPHHLLHASDHDRVSQPIAFKQTFTNRFDQLREKVYRLAQLAIHYRYATVGLAIGMLLISIAMMAGGFIKFKAFPDLDGDIVEARLLMPQGTPLNETKKQMDNVYQSLKTVGETISTREGQPYIQNVRIRYGYNPDANENGPHIATLSADLLKAEVRQTQLSELFALWREAIGPVPNALSLQLKEPSLGPSGRAIEIRVSGENLDELSAASQEMSEILKTYPGTYDIQPDLRPGKPEFSLNLKDGAYALGVDSTTIAQQLRTALNGQKVDSVQMGSESYDVTLQYDLASRDSLSDFDYLPIVNESNGAQVPLTVVANVTPTRSWSRIHRVNNERTVTITGEVDNSKANVQELLNLFVKEALPGIQDRYPLIKVDLEGEVKKGAETSGSIGQGFMLSLIGIFLLLSLQFKNYIEPLVVMIAIPLALIGSIWGHFIMGLDFSMPSMMGFVSLAGIVVNNSILLVEFVKHELAEGISIHEAAALASRNRFRAIFITTLTTTAGMTPLLFETSLQAQVLIPLICSIVFGLLVSTVMVLFVIPAAFTILEDFGFQDSDSK